VLGASLALAGCFLERSGTAQVFPGADASTMDAGGRGDGGASVDAGPGDAGLDGGVDSAIEVEDGCVPSAEVCDNVDNDCDGFIDGLTRPCATACGEGTETCTLGAWSCDAREPSVETCNNVDDDCDGTVDGFAEACDVGCGPGLRTCTAGSFGECSAAPSMEICDNVDNDCDGTVDMIDRPCTDACGTAGIETCVAGSFGSCSAATPMETCDGVDEDCDGTVDEGAGCPCTQVIDRGHSYLFCNDNDTWTEAREECSRLGYHLITINDMAESDVANMALTVANNDWWIGINDRDTERTWVWDVGSSSYTNWGDDEPDNFNAATYDCGRIENGGSFEDRGEWGDAPCGDERPYICEAEP